jgi:hypothetical protein
VAEMKKARRRWRDPSAIYGRHGLNSSARKCRARSQPLEA